MEILHYRQISFDSTHLLPGRPINATFFDAASRLVDGSPRVTSFAEKTIIQWLMLIPECRLLVFEELGLPADAFYCREVVRPFYAPGEGDLDLVMCPRLSPQFAVALECKRVKVEIVNLDHDKINKLQDVGGGVHQANKLYNGCFGFFQTYLAIITEVDASSQAERNIPARGVRSHTRPNQGDTNRTTLRQIVEFPRRENLDSDIGIIFLELVQPSRSSIDRTATLRVCVYRQAESRDQADSVTNRISELMAGRS